MQRTSMRRTEPIKPLDEGIRELMEPSEAEVRLELSARQSHDGVSVARRRVGRRVEQLAFSNTGPPRVTRRVPSPPPPR